MNAHFRVGEKVRVEWMGEVVAARIIEVVWRESGKRLSSPYYRLAIDGRRPAYREDEFTRRRPA